MPSNSFQKFIEGINDINKLIELYETIEVLDELEEEKVAKKFNVLFRSGVVLLVSYWESYVEDVCDEALMAIVERVQDPNKLPKELRKKVAKELKESKEELKLWDLSGDGWRKIVMGRVDQYKIERNRSFNTPKFTNTVEFINNVIGVKDIFKNIKWDGYTHEEVSARLNSLIEVRGQIAHRGKTSIDIDGKYLTDHLNFVRQLVSKFGGKINSHVKDVTGIPLFKK